MPELSDQMYCSEQITIPPSFPYLLRQYAKAAIRTQPMDLLKWSTAYFRCLSLNIPPPVKPRLEYPIPRTFYGLTPGWLKALMYQLQNNQTIAFKILYDRWTGACLEHSTLIKILCLGGFDNPAAIPWLRFIGLCAAHLTENVTRTMSLICEIMTEEPEGGSATITLETFIDLYKFLAAIDASQRQKLKNIYFLDSLLSLWREQEESEEKEKEEVQESVMEEISIKSEESAKELVSEVREAEVKESISCPSIAGDETYVRDYYIPPPPEEGEDEDREVEEEGSESYSERRMGSLVLQPEETEDEAQLGSPTEEGDEDIEHAEEEERRSDEDDSLQETRETAEQAEDEESPHSSEIDYESYLGKIDTSDMGERKDGSKQVSETETEEGQEPGPYQSVETIIEEPRRIDAHYLEDEKALHEDLEKLKEFQQEIAGETDEELEKYKCRLIEEMPLTTSQRDAIASFGIVEEKIQDVEEKEELEEEKAEEPPYEEIWVDAVPGIGPILPDPLVEAVCNYMKSVASIQHGMVMPRNIRHYNCPPLEILEY